MYAIVSPIYSFYLKIRKKKKEKEKGLKKKNLVSPFFFSFSAWQCLWPLKAMKRENPEDITSECGSL